MAREFGKPGRQMDEMRGGFCSLQFECMTASDYSRRSPSSGRRPRRLRIERVSGVTPLQVGYCVLGRARTCEALHFAFELFTVVVQSWTIDTDSPTIAHLRRHEYGSTLRCKSVYQESR